MSNNLSYTFSAGGEHNGQFLFQAVLYQRGRPVAEYNLWLSTITPVLTTKVDSFERGKGFASEIIKRTIPERLEQIAAEYGSFTHQEEFTPLGERLRPLILSLGYVERNGKLVRDYPSKI